MNKVINAVFGIGVAVVVYIVILLGIQTFYPEPQYDDFCETNRFFDPLHTCPDDITVGECRATTNVDKEEQQRCQREYESANKRYGQNFFMIASATGVIVLISSYFLMSMVNIAAGVASSGIILILWAFMRGWQSTDDMMKFLVALVVAAIVISLTVIINKRFKK